MSATGKDKCRPLESLVESGAFRAMTNPEQIYVVALDFFTQRDSGLCYPSERIIAERFGLSRSRQQEGRKRCLARNVFTVEMRKVNRRGNAVMHYRWQPEAWKSATSQDHEPRPNLGATPTQFGRNPDPISDGGNGRKGTPHMGNPDPNRDGVASPKPLINPLLNPSAPHSLSPKEKKELEVERALCAGQNPKGQEHNEEYWTRVRTLKAQGLEGEALMAALEAEGIK